MEIKQKEMSDIHFLRVLKIFNTKVSKSAFVNELDCNKVITFAFTSFP